VRQHGFADGDAWLQNWEAAWQVCVCTHCKRHGPWLLADAGSCCSEACRWLRCASLGSPCPLAAAHSPALCRPASLPAPLACLPALPAEQPGPELRARDERHMHDPSDVRRDRQLAPGSFPFQSGSIFSRPGLAPGTVAAGLLVMLSQSHSYPCCSCKPLTLCYYLCRTFTAPWLPETQHPSLSHAPGRS